MKKKSLALMTAIMCVAGTCMHFVCDAVSAEPVRTVLSLVFPANETSWEHMKMIWVPFLVAGLLLSIRKRNGAYLSGMVVAGITGMLLQLGLFALYQSLIGSSVLFLDIIFYLGDMILCVLLGLMLANRSWAKKTWPLWALVAVAVSAAEVYLTFQPGSGYVFLDDAGLKSLGL